MEIERTRMPERLMTRARNVSALINTRVIMTLPSILAEGESFALKIRLRIKALSSAIVESVSTMLTSI